MKYLRKALSWFLGLLMLFIIVLTTVNVLLRAGGASLVWAEEVTRFTMIWIVFVGAGFLVLDDSHISMSALFDRLSARPKSILTIISSAAAIMVAALLSILACKVVVKVAALGQKSPAAQIPIFLVYLSLVFGFILMAAMYLRQLILLPKTGYGLGHRREDGSCDGSCPGDGGSSFSC